MREAQLPERIGPYSVLGVLGEGGMGIVYHVQQQEPVAREAALKVLKPGMDSRSVVSRFEVERQSLAVMEHPSIAQVFDAGLTDDGRPYFVMELVRGVPITEYCDGERLSLRDRVLLFKSVCHAVQHAHGKGLIHRDLKPSNVLITEQSGDPVPKVIDFGIARAVSMDDEVATRLTQEGHVVGTPAYMAPEQLLGEDHLIDTRADVFALGVLLYEVLIGALPFDAGSYRGAAVYGLLQRDAPTPSERLGRLDTAEQLARARGGDLASVRRELKGDLDWIVTRAMARERDRRYETVHGLAMELQRYLDREPVLARPPSTAYRMTRFVQRHRAAVLAGAAAVLLLVAGSISTTVGMLRAREAERRAVASQAESDQVANFLLDIFELSDPSLNGGDITARALLDQAYVNVQTDLPEQPVLQARLLTTMGDVYQKLALWEPALTAIDRADSLYLSAQGPESLDRTSVLFERANTLQQLGRFQESAQVLREVLRIRSLYLPESREGIFDARNSLAINLEQLGQLDSAEAVYRDLLKTGPELFGMESNNVAQVANNLGVLLELNREFEAADSMYTLALDLWTAMNGEESWRVTRALQNLVALDLSRDEISDTTVARALRALEIRELLLEPDHPDVGGALLNLSAVYQRRGQVDEAEPVVERATEILTAAFGSAHPEVALAHEHMSSIHRARGEVAEAAAEQRRALEVYQEMHGPGHLRVAMAAGPLADLLEQLDEWEEAAELYRRAAEIEEDGRGRWEGVVWLMGRYANALRQLGRDAAAEVAEAKAAEIQAELDAAS